MLVVAKRQGERMPEMRQSDCQVTMVVVTPVFVRQSTEVTTGPVWLVGLFSSFVCYRARSVGETNT
jgi:hypothetical protein